MGSRRRHHLPELHHHDHRRQPRRLVPGRDRGHRTGPRDHLPRRADRRARQHHRRGGRRRCARLADRSRPGVPVPPDARNEGAENRYWFTAGESESERFDWAGPRRRLAEFTRTPGEEGGRYLEDAEKAAILAAAGVLDLGADRSGSSRPGW